MHLFKPKNLYVSKSIDVYDITKYSQNVDFLKLDDCERNACDLLPTTDGYTDAVHNFRSNKPPGLDGLPGEFYKRFWETIEPHFNDIFYVYLKKQKNSKQLFHITLLFNKKTIKKTS